MRDDNIPLADDDPQGINGYEHNTSINLNQ